MKFTMFLVLAAAVVTAGCGKVPATHFYTLEPPAMAAGTRNLPYEMAVARFHAEYRLSQDRLVYMPAPYHVDYYEHHRWAGFPADLVTSAMVTSLREAGLFRTVIQLQSGMSPDYLLRGEIHNLEEVDVSGTVKAKVAISVNVLDAKTHALVWTGDGSAERPVTAGDVDNVARELNAGVQESLAKIIHQMVEKFPDRSSGTK